MQLKEDQWYQLPSGQWVQAVWVDDPLGPILHAYGTDLASSTGSTNAFDIYVERDGFTLGVHRAVYLGHLDARRSARGHPR